MKESPNFEVYSKPGFFILINLIPAIIATSLSLIYIYTKEKFELDFLLILFILLSIIFFVATYRTLFHPRPLLSGDSAGLRLNIIPFTKGLLVPWVEISSIKSDQVIHRFNKYDLIAKPVRPMILSRKIQEDHLLLISFMKSYKLPKVMKNVIKYTEDSIWLRVKGDLEKVVTLIRTQRNLYR